MSVLSKGRFAKDSDVAMAKKILGAVGLVFELEEKMLDIVTAVSGSGPAYVFYFIEAMIEAGVKNGLTEEVAGTLAVQTVYGAAKLALETKEAPAELRNKVTSKGGTTEEAIKVIEKNKLKKIMGDAVNAAMKKSKEMTR